MRENGFSTDGIYDFSARLAYPERVGPGRQDDGGRREIGELKEKTRQQRMYVVKITYVVVKCMRKSLQCVS